MTYITATFTIIVTLSWWQRPVNASNLYDFDNTVYVKEYTRKIILKQGALQGVVVAFRLNRELPPVEQYKGIPYAAPPVGELRFMPSGSPPSWFGTKFADAFGPACPQKFPDPTKMGPERREQFFRLQKYLQNQSEDCLYLNIYAPYQEPLTHTRKYPVMVYIHGESFEWNSGNHYDGSVLAAYGKVIVVTLNYRLGVLGFLKAGTDYARSNFGLVDQIAALLWVKANIAAFGGDPNTITLFGHGTGAASASLLMLSPMVLEGNKMLFQRAILMSGTALSDWALASHPQGVTYHVAQALNCQIEDDFEACLRRKRLDDIMGAETGNSPYRTTFGPVVDSIVVPNDPKKLMTTYSDMFKRFELMYGVTEMESIHLLGPEALKHGMLEKDRDQQLRMYLNSRCEMKPELCVTRTLAEYTDTEFTMDDEIYREYTGHEPDRASLARDALLDILSDARNVAPMVQMAKYHSSVNPQSYFYVFTHKTQSKEYIRNKSHNGEELPYVFGVPLGGSKFHFVDHYSEKERLLSEAIMTYFCNFAYTGDPNVPRKAEFKTLGPREWIQFDVDWPEYDLDQERYLQLDIPPHISSHYRDREMRYWNDVFPTLSTRNVTTPLVHHQPMKTVPSYQPKSPPPWILTSGPKRGSYNNKYENFNKPIATKTNEIYGVVKFAGTAPPDNMVHPVEFGTVVNTPQDNAGHGTSTTIFIAMAAVFLLFNIFLFSFLFLKRYKKKTVRSSPDKVEDSINQEESQSKPQDVISNGCNIMKIVSKSSPSDDAYEAVKPGNSKNKLPRQMSSSTIDAHTKVRDWITNEIIYKYSPRFLRRPRHQDDLKFAVHTRDSMECTPLNDNCSTLGRSPTRPVTPSDNLKPVRPPLIKSSSIPVQKSKKPEKVSVAIDATPSGRGNSVLQQQPIELTKSLDRPNFESPLRRSITLDDFSAIKSDDKQEIRKSVTNINLSLPKYEEATVIRIEHSHSKSEPVQDLYAYSKAKKLKTFDPNNDVNVTSRDENVQTMPLTPEESLMTIKRRNFPKVLPDYPTKEALARKRRSMPVSNHTFMPILEIPTNSPTKLFGKLPPEPPPRTTSTLTRQGSQTQPVCQSAPMLAEEPPASPEPEVTFNNLYVGPLIPKLSKTALSCSESSTLNTQPIYDSLRAAASETENKAGNKPVAKTIITTDPNQPIRKIDAKVIIKPTMSRSVSDPKKHIPRVVATDNVPTVAKPTTEDCKEDDKLKKSAKPSQIPTLVKCPKESSSSESSPSEESDTGTVVKKI